MRSAADDDEVPTVGDWVLAAPDAAGDWWVVRRLPPVNRIVRRGSDGGRRQALVANVDTALLVMGLDADFNLRRLERYLALARLAGVGAVVVLTKADGCTAERRDGRLADVRGRLSPGTAALAVDAREPQVRDALAPWLGRGCTLVLLGSSGAGKSTLTNTLTASATQASGPVREGDSRGRHTTTARSLHRCEGGASIIDTPGLRTLRLDADEAGLEAAFADIAGLAAQCRFRDCRHADEPGCRVREQLPPESLANYFKLQREARRDTLDASQRRERLSQWKARGREARVNMRAKRGA